MGEDIFSSDEFVDIPAPHFNVAQAHGLYSVFVCVFNSTLSKEVKVFVGILNINWNTFLFIITFIFITSTFFRNNY